MGHAKHTSLSHEPISACQHLLHTSTCQHDVIQDLRSPAVSMRGAIIHAIPRSLKHLPACQHLRCARMIGHARWSQREGPPGRRDRMEDSPPQDTRRRQAPERSHSPQRRSPREQYQEPQQQKSAFTYNFFATCHPGLEEMVAQELVQLGIPNVEPGHAGVTFRSNRLADGYRANLWLRCAIRVLLLLGQGPLDTWKDGYDSLYEVVRGCGADWAGLIPEGATISIEPRLWSCTGITSSKLVWQRVKDAVCDAVYDARRERLQPPPRDQLADVPLYVAAYRDNLTIYRDMSGRSLHRRGYREGMHRSPLNEAAAAGLLMMGGWHRLCQNGEEAVLADPMCGSGTLLIEAALIAQNIAPGLSRATEQVHRFPCTSWPDADKQGWQQAVQEAVEARRPWSGRLYGNDIHEGALRLAMHDVRQAQCTHITRVRQGDCAHLELPEVPDLVVVNPPWGMRLMSQEQGRGRAGPVEDAASSSDAPADVNQFNRNTDSVGSEPAHEDALRECWLGLSDFLRSQCPDSNALVLSGNKAAFNYLRMRPAKKWTMTVGGVDTWANLYHVLPPKPVTTQPVTTPAA